MTGAIRERRAELVFDDEPERRIRLRIERPEEAEGDLPVVIVLHGFKGFMHWGFFPELSRRIAGDGMVCVSMNASGSGVGADDVTMNDEEAFERNTYSRELEDLDCVREFARVLEGVDPAREGLVGHSRGGGVAILSAAAQAPNALVTWAAIDDVDRVDAQAKERWRERGFLEIPNARTGQIHRIGLDALRDVEENRERLDILAAAARVDCPALVVHGTGDEGVPFSAAERIARALPGAELLSLEGAGHTFGARHPWAGTTPDFTRALDATLDHLRRELRAAPPG